MIILVYHIYIYDYIRIYIYLILIPGIPEDDALFDGQGHIILWTIPRYIPYDCWVIHMYIHHIHPDTST